MFVIPDGAAGALAELERRKFTAEEGVSSIAILEMVKVDWSYCRGPVSGPFDAFEW